MKSTTLLVKACSAGCAECKFDNPLELGMFLLQKLSQLRIYILSRKYSEQNKAVERHLVTFSDEHNSVNIQAPHRYIVMMVGSALKRLQHTTRSNRRVRPTTGHSKLQNKKTLLCSNRTQTLADSSIAVLSDAVTQILPSGDLSIVVGTGSITLDITSVGSVAGYPTKVADTGCTTQDFPPISSVESFGMVDTSSVVLKSSHTSNDLTNADHCST
jgi:hypothetical protein